MIATGHLPVEALENRTLFAAAVALSSDGRLITFDTTTPNTASLDVAVTGLQSGESLVGIDYRPADGKLYGVGSTSRLYVIDDKTAVATQIGTPFAVPLEGNAFGVDFNPVVDRLRVVSNTDQNLRINPNSGAVADFDLVTAGTQPDGDLNYSADPSADPVVVSAGYVNAFSGAASTLLYGIDSQTDSLVTIGSADGTTSPNSGTSFVVGSLGVNATKFASLDINYEAGANVAYALLQTTAANRPALYTINLTTGTAAPVLAGQTLGRFVPTGFSVKPAAPEALVLTTNSQLIRVAIDAPTVPLARLAVTGLAQGDSLVGIDFRPANGMLYGLGALSNLYTINATTGAATQVGTTFSVPLRGNSWGFDFNPTVDRIRVFSNSGQNLRLNPDTGAVVDADLVAAGTQIDGSLAYVAGDANAAAAVPIATAAAYTNSTAGAMATNLFGLDTELNTLFRVGTAAGVTPAVSPNTGTSYTIGTLGIDVVRRTAFDVFSSDAANRGLAVLQVDGQTRPGLYNIDLRTGEAIRIGSIGNNRTVVGFSVVPIT